MVAVIVSLAVIKLLFAVIVSVAVVVSVSVNGWVAVVVSVVVAQLLNVKKYYKIQRVTSYIPCPNLTVSPRLSIMNPTKITEKPFQC